jgi:hypothetical protein
LNMLPDAASGFSTARVSIEDKSLTWAMLVSCIPEPGIGTGLFRTIPAHSRSKSGFLMDRKVKSWEKIQY